MTEPGPEPEQTGGTSSAKTGRGGLALAGGKVFFLFAGLLQQVALKSILGLGGYGALSTAQSVASISYNPLVQAGIQGVSRETAGIDAEEQERAFRSLLTFHLLVSVGAAILFFIFAKPVAHFIGAPHVTSGIQILSGILFLYGLYAPMIGYLNGKKRFLSQAGLDVLSATLRTCGLLGGAYFAARHLGDIDLAAHGGELVDGTVIGFVLAGVLILAVATKLTGIGRSGKARRRWSAYAMIIVPILFGQVLLNLLFQADALLLRKFAAEAALQTGQLPVAADPYVGAYRATQLFCFLPFQLLTSVTFVLFPLLATARTEGKPEQIAHLVQRGLRFALLIAGLIVSVIVAVPGGLLALVFGAEASELGSHSMRILAVGMGFFAILGVMTAALNSLGNELRSLALIATAAALVFALCISIAERGSLSASLLESVATGTTIAMLAATGATGWVLSRVSGARLSWLSLLRTCTAVGLAGFTGAQFFTGGVILTLLGAIFSGIIFILALTLTGELTKTDFQLAMSLVKR